MLKAESRLLIGLVAAIGASFIAGCCGGPFSADGEGGCSACAAPAADPDCVEPDAAAPSDAAAAGAGGG